MKKPIKATALLLAVTMTLTACDSPKVNLNRDLSDEQAETHKPDETHTYTWYHMVTDTYADEGEVIKYDKNWKMTVHRTQKDGQWTTLTDLAKEKEAQREKLIRLGATAAVFGLMFAIAIPVCRSASKDIDKMRAAKEKQKQAYRVEYNDLIRQRDVKLNEGKAKDALELEKRAEALNNIMW